MNGTDDCSTSEYQYQRNRRIRHADVNKAVPVNIRGCNQFDDATNSISTTLLSALAYTTRSQIAFCMNTALNSISQCNNTHYKHEITMHKYVMRMMSTNEFSTRVGAGVELNDPPNTSSSS